MAQAYLSQRKLDSEAKQLQANIGQFSKNMAQWLELMEKLNKSVNVSQWRSSTNRPSDQVKPTTCPVTQLTGS